MSWGGLLYRAGIAVCAVGLLVSGGLFMRQWLEYRAGENAYEALTEAAVTPTPQPQAEAPEEPAGEAAPIQVDFDALSAVNPDVTGWIYLPDSVISYPVVQGEDNSYYLKHLFDGTPNSSGCLFLDSRCEGLTGRNSVIYGHYMKNGTLFGSLKEYRDQAYSSADKGGGKCKLYWRGSVQNSPGTPG